MKKILFSVLAVAAVACTSEKKTTLNGTVPEGVEKVSVKVSELGIDTLITVNNGSFTVDLPFDKTVSGMVSVAKNRTQFVLDGTTLTLQEDGDALVAKSSKPASSITERMNEFVFWLKDFMNRYEETADEDVEALMEEYQDKLEGCARANSDNAFGIMCIQCLDGMMEPARLSEIISSLAPEIREKESIASIARSIDSKATTAVGMMFTDFEVPQPDGTVKKLSDYVGKGKYILADFWASWCGPCRREIPNIKKVYDKFHGPKFDVVSIAVWDKLEDTKKAIEVEGLKWNQILDGQHIPTDAYGITGIPELILFAPDGTILKRGEDLRGDNMEPAIAEYLKK